MVIDVSHPSEGTLMFLKAMTVVAIIGALNWG
jgi:hypothetical protein